MKVTRSEKFCALAKKMAKPKILTSVVAELTSMSMLFNVHVDIGIVEMAVAALCGILVLLGIITDPNAEKKGYADDIRRCSHCQKNTSHVRVNGNMLCRTCGGVYDETGTSTVVVEVKKAE